MDIAVFVDGANLYYTQRDHLGWWVDPKKLLAWINELGNVTDALYYLGAEDVPDGAYAGFLRVLPRIGYSLVTKPVKTQVGPNGEIRKKANLDVELALDMFTMLECFDMAVLVSGDGDFRKPLELLRTRGKRFVVLSTEGVVARELREVAGRHVVGFRDIRQFVERDCLRHSAPDAVVRMPVVSPGVVAGTSRMRKFASSSAVIQSSTSWPIAVSACR